MPKLLQKAPTRIHHISRDEFVRSQEVWDPGVRVPILRGGYTTCRASTDKKNLTDNWRMVNCPSCLKKCPPEFASYKKINLKKR